MPKTTEALMNESHEKLQNEYFLIAPLAIRFSTALKEEFEELLQSERIPLGVPIECRVKKWDSIIEKIKRKSLDIGSVMDVADLVGLRLMLLFSRDVAKVGELISKTFTVLQREDTQTRLGEAQFGYQSFHYLIQLPDAWLRVPSFAALGNYKAEIQIRTLAQHIWAAASHVLQYKHEASVPLPVRRSIHRVSALLETVDLEFERVLDARESYVSQFDLDKASGPLNVDLLASILDQLLPPANKDDEEPYAELLGDLINFGIDSPKKLQSLISKHLEGALKADAQRVKEILAQPDEVELDPQVKRGVFYTHVGLTRGVLKEEFGEEALGEYFGETQSIESAGEE
jgi:putative GTP pyrophosphokinase